MTVEFRGEDEVVASQEQESAWLRRKGQGCLIMIVGLVVGGALALLGWAA